MTTPSTPPPPPGPGWYPQGPYPYPPPKRKSGLSVLLIPLVLLGGGALVVFVFFVAVVMVFSSGSDHHSAPPSAAAPSSIASLPSQAPPAETIQQWAVRSHPAMDNLSATLMSVGQAFTEGRMADGRVGCRQLATDVNNLAAVLPTPDAALTRELQGVVTNYRQAAAMCQSFDESTPASYIQQARQYLNSGNANMEAATTILANLNARTG